MVSWNVLQDMFSGIVSCECQSVCVCLFGCLSVSLLYLLQRTPGSLSTCQWLPVSDYPASACPVTSILSALFCAGPPVCVYVCPYLYVLTASKAREAWKGLNEECRVVLTYDLTFLHIRSFAILVKFFSYMTLNLPPIFSLLHSPSFVQRNCVTVWICFTFNSPLFYCLFL